MWQHFICEGLGIIYKLQLTWYQHGQEEILCCCNREGTRYLPLMAGVSGAWRRDRPDRLCRRWAGEDVVGGAGAGVFRVLWATV